MYGLSEAFELMLHASELARDRAGSSGG